VLGVSWFCVVLVCVLVGWGGGGGGGGGTNLAASCSLLAADLNESWRTLDMRERECVGVFERECACV